MMSNKNIWFATAILIVFTLLISENLYSKTYYVSNSGSDSNSGESTSSPWRTLSKVNNSNFNSGDIILFNRGDNWFGQLIPVSGSSSAYITYGAYGSGNKPLIHKAVEKNSTNDWDQESTNIWVANNLPEDVGNIIFNNEASCGVKLPNQSGLGQQGEFWYDASNDLVKLYSSQNPATYYSDIKCALFGHLIEQRNKSYVIYEDLALKYGGSHGIGGINTHHIIARDLDIAYMGGCYLPGYGDGTTRYGNGIEFWGGAHDNLVEGCKIWEIYDAALTNQSAVSGNQYNITYKNNVIQNSEYSYEFFHHVSSSSVDNIHFINNTCINAGYGWGHNQRPKPSGRHIHCWEITANMSNLVIENNIFHTAKEYLINLPDNDHDVHSQLKMDYNCLYQTSGKLVIIEVSGEVGVYGKDEFELYQKKTRYGKNSQNCEPKLVGYNLSRNSCCIDAGNPLYHKDPDETRSDIGAKYFHQE